jgi:predicted AAA+ superfamily ATPase
MKLKREIEKQLEEYRKSKENKILFVWGPRRSGKTTILRKMAKEWGETVYNFDLETDREKFVTRREDLEKLVAKHKIIMIDEVQNYPESTVVLKVLHDEYGIKIIATGSSELRQKGETFDSLVGRFREIFCLPLSVFELKDNEIEKRLDLGLVWGGYPEVLAEKSEVARIEMLENIVSNYVLKDIVDIYDLKNAKLARDLLTKVALQLGSELSLRELANSLGTNAMTVANYLEILVKNYIVIPLPSFKTNLRKAVSENKKYYFWDLGLRNALVSDFRPVKLRPDAGGIWENWVVMEWEKQKRMKNLKLKSYFYREYGGREVDMIIEDYQKKYVACEIKQKGGTVAKIFPLEHKATVINRENAEAELGRIGRIG